MQTAKPFATIESSVEFIKLLNCEIAATAADVETDLNDAKSDADQRRIEALQLVIYKLKQLSQHMQQSERLLHDLERLERVILPEKHGKSLAAGLRSD